MKLVKTINTKIKYGISKISDKTLSIGMVMGLLLSVLPILMLAFYNYPCADDFSASDTAHWAWQETGSLIEVLKAAVENVIYNYYNWSGVYTSVLWTSLQPGLFGERFYGITTVISVVLFLAAGGYLTYVIGSKYLKANPWSWMAVCVLYLFTSIQCMPDGNEGLYWHAGGANYTWAFAFLLLLTGTILSVYREEHTLKSTLKTVASCVLAILVGGGNYITALQGCIWLILLDVIMIYSKGRSNGKAYGKVLWQNAAALLPTIVLIVAFLISVMAPGNAVRMGASKGMGGVEAVVESFRYAFFVPLESWLTWPVWILLLTAIPFMGNIVKQTEFKFSLPGFILVLSFCLVAAGFTPSLYAQGAVQAGRLQDTVYYILILLLYVSVFYITGWIYHRYLKRQDREKHKTELTYRAKKWVLALLIVWVLGSLPYMKIDTGIYIGTDALYAIASGKAAQYRETNERRLEILAGEEKQVILPKFTNVPELLQFEDIYPNPQEWLNTAMAVYYKKESVQREN